MPPFIVAASVANQATATTTHTINLPTGAVSGDLVIWGFAKDVTSTTTTWQSGWTVLCAETANGTEVEYEIRYRVMDGSEGASETNTTSANTISASWMARIGRHDSSTNAPQCGTPATGTTNAPNPPSLTPSGGSNTYLWIESHASDDDDNTANYQSANYWPLRQVEGATSGTPVLTAVAYRDANTASSEDPGNMAMAASEGWVANTIAVHPGTEGTAAGFVQRGSNTVGSGTTVVVTLPLVSTSGNMMVAAVTFDPGVDLSTVTDNKGNSYTLFEGETSFLGGTAAASSNYAANITGGGAAVQVTFTFSALTFAGASVAEYHGMDAATPLDSNNEATGTSVSPASATAATTNADDILIGYLDYGGGVLSTTGDYVQRGPFVADREVTSTGSFNVQATLSTSNDWIVQHGAFKKAGGGGGGGTSTPAQMLMGVGD